MTETNKMCFSTLREHLAYQPLLLGTVALIAAGALSAAHALTASQIIRADASDQQRLLAQVLPPDFADNDLLTDVRTLAATESTPERTVYLAKKSGRVVGVVIPLTAHGYAGEISLMMAIDKDGRVLGVRVLKHSETPGLGDKIELARNPWIKGFDGLSLANPQPDKWAVKKDGGAFDAFAGATITPRAMVRAVKEGLEYFATQRETLLADHS